MIAFASLFVLMGIATAQPAPAHKPGDQVEWVEYPAQKKLSDPSWGEFLTDIENHLPIQFGIQYRDSDKTTWAHETTHGIQAHINMTYRKDGDKARSYGMYVGGNKVAMIPQPKIRITNVAEVIPQSLRKSRYTLYLVTQAKAWNTDPIYLFDEWNAYVNGATTGIELGKKGKAAVFADPTCNGTDAVLGCLEFNVYAIHLCMATKDLDPTYDAKQLLEFTAWNSKRCMNIYNEGYKLEIFNWDKHEYLTFLQTHDDARKMREFVIETWGATWADEVFGFKAQGLGKDLLRP